MAILGMRGTGNFGPVEEPESGAGILLYFPNGDAADGVPLEAPRAADR